MATPGDTDTADPARRRGRRDTAHEVVILLGLPARNPRQVGPNQTVTVGPDEVDTATGVLPGQPPGLYDIEVETRAVLAAGDLRTAETVQVIDEE